MKITRKKNKKLITTLSILAIIILCIGGYFAYKYFSSPVTPTTETNTPVDKPQRSETDKKQSEALKSNPSKKTESSNSDEPQAPTKSDDGSQQVVQVTATTNQDATNVYIRGGVNYPVRDGQCTVTLTSSAGKTITKTTSILTGPASADCKTIQIPISELEKGKWSFKLSYSSAEYTGESESVSFNIQ